MESGGVRLVHGGEEVEISYGAPVRRVVHLTGGLQNRRGLCGLLRIEFREMSQGSLTAYVRPAEPTPEPISLYSSGSMRRRTVPSLAGSGNAKTTRRTTAGPSARSTSSRVSTRGSTTSGSK